MSKKVTLEWFSPEEKMPELPKGTYNIQVFIVSKQGGWITTVGYSKYGFNTSDFSEYKDWIYEPIHTDSELKVRAWAYIPEELMEIAKEEDTEDETV